MAVDQKTIDTAAQSLRDAGETRQAIAPLSDALPRGDVDLGYAIQNVNTDHWVKQGRRIAGYKIGLTAKSVQAQLGVDQPDYGVLFADMAISDSEDIAFQRLMQPKVEGEIAFVLDRDLDRDTLTQVDLVQSIAYALPAIEVVDSRIANWKIGILDTIADNASSALYVLGATPRSLSDFDLWSCGMVMEHRGEPVSVGAGAACLGHPLTSSLWLARKMVAMGRPLKAGDVILSGALGPMVPAAAGGVYELRINGLGSVRAMFGQGDAA